MASFSPWIQSFSPPLHYLLTVRFRLSLGEMPHRSLWLHLAKTHRSHRHPHLHHYQHGLFSPLFINHFFVVPQTHLQESQLDLHPPHLFLRSPFQQSVATAFEASRTGRPFLMWSSLG